MQRASANEAWAEMDRLSSNVCMQAAIPALALLRADHHTLTPGREKRDRAYSMQVVDLRDHCGTVTSILHLVYEVGTREDQSLLMK